MKAAVFHGRLDIRLDDISVPEPGDGELLLEVSVVGVCGTDASEFSRGPSMFPIEHRHPITGHHGPMVPGHEFSGRVAAVGSNVTGFSEGDLVTSGAGISCGRCRWCKAGRNNLCDRYSSVGLERNGALAEFTTVPASACLNVEARPLTADVAAMAQPMSIAVHAMRRGRPVAGSRVAVIGAGAIGAFLIHAAAKAGIDVTAIDLDEQRLGIARALGADETIHASVDAPLVDQLRDVGLRPEIVYECTGVDAGIHAAAGVVERGGRVVVVGLQKSPVALDLTALALREQELIGTLAHVFDADFGHAVDLLTNETELWAHVAPTVLPLDHLVDHALGPMLDGRPAPIKALLDPRLAESRPIDTGGAGD